MKKLLITLLLFSCGAAFAGQAEDLADQLAAENLGLTLEGYRSLPRYKAYKADKEKRQQFRAECELRLSDINERDRSQRNSFDRLDQSQRDLDAELDSLKFRKQLLLATPGGPSDWFVDQWNQDNQNWKERAKERNRKSDEHNHRQRILEEDIDTYNNECAK